MAKFALHQGDYQARSPIANAQVCMNLYPEPNPQDAPFPVTHYPAPGLGIFLDLTGQFPGATVRGLYKASNGQLFGCIGTNLVQFDLGPPAIVLGQFPYNSGLPVSICDNGATVVAVDGSPNGVMWPIAGGGGSAVPITDSAFYGSNRVDYIDTFMVFNIPGTGTFYTTTSGVVTPFDPTYAAAKEGWNDLLVCACCLHDNIWLLGDQTAEIWYNAGGTTFPFARMPNSILQQGCVAPYSAVIADNALYWLSQDRWGHNMMMRGQGYMAKRISTFAVEQIWNGYATPQDCVGMAFQLAGHESIGFLFPSANAYWVYDALTQMWHQRSTAGNAWLPYCTAFWGTTGGGQNINIMAAGDRTSARILLIERGTYTDAGTPITRQRSWMHSQADSGQRVHHARFSLDMNGNYLAPDGVALDWSDDGGQTYGAQVSQTVQASGYPASYGQYQWRRLGYARDRVYRTTFSAQGEFAINGAYLDTINQGT